MQWQPHAQTAWNKTEDLNQALLQSVKEQAHSLKYIPCPEASSSSKVAPGQALDTSVFCEASLS